MGSWKMRMIDIHYRELFFLEPRRSDTSTESTNRSKSKLDSFQIIGLYMSI